MPAKEGAETPMAKRKPDAPTGASGGREDGSKKVSRTFDEIRKRQGPLFTPDAVDLDQLVQVCFAPTPHTVPELTLPLSPLAVGTIRASVNIRKCGPTRDEGPGGEAGADEEREGRAQGSSINGKCQGVSLPMALPCALPLVWFFPRPCSSLGLALPFHLSGLRGL